MTQQTCQGRKTEESPVASLFLIAFHELADDLRPMYRCVVDVARVWCVCIFLRIVGELSVEETARVLNRPVCSVKALQRRGLAALKRQIREIGVSR